MFDQRELLLMTHSRTCRFCSAELNERVLDLGVSPLCQKHVTPARYYEAECFYPLQVWICTSCWLMQLEEMTARDDIFDEAYGYFSSYSDSWLAHAREYVAQVTERFGLDSSDLVVEIASNDGYLLRWFDEKGIPVLGVEPSANVAHAAMNLGIPTEIRFFGRDTAHELLGLHGRPKLMVGNNVLAHVPDINDFVAGIKVLLAPDGVVTMEFPHLQQLIDQNQFDTIYHEHFSYLSFFTVQKIFSSHGLELFDVEELSTHGGSIRIFGRHAGYEALPVMPRVKALLQREFDLGMQTLAYYRDFQDRVISAKSALIEFLLEAKKSGKRVVGYGAPGKGNTLLNYCGIKTDLIEYTVDRSHHKQGNYLPGSRLPVFEPQRIALDKPDYVLILPWNLKKEIAEQMDYIADWGGQFVVPIPTTGVFSPKRQFVIENDDVR